MHSGREIKEALISGIKNNLLAIDVKETNEALQNGQMVKFVIELHENQDNKVECYSFEFGV